MTSPKMEREKKGVAGVTSSLFSLVQHPSSFIHGMLTRLWDVLPTLQKPGSSHSRHQLSLYLLWHQKSWNLGFYFSMPETLAVSDTAAPVGTEEQLNSTTPSLGVHQSHFGQWGPTCAL